MSKHFDYGDVEDKMTLPSLASQSSREVDVIVLSDDSHSSSELEYIPLSQRIKPTQPVSSLTTTANINYSIPSTSYQKPQRLATIKHKNKLDGSSGPALAHQYNLLFCNLVMVFLIEISEQGILSPTAIVMILICQFWRFSVINLSPR